MIVSDKCSVSWEKKLKNSIHPYNFYISHDPVQASIQESDRGYRKSKRFGIRVYSKTLYIYYSW